MALDVEVTAQARADITRSAYWWADNHSVQEALDWEPTVTHQISQIGFAPESHSFSDECDTFPVEMREALVGRGQRRSHRAVFIVRYSSCRMTN